MDTAVVEDQTSAWDEICTPGSLGNNDLMQCHQKLSPKPKNLAQAALTLCLMAEKLQLKKAIQDYATEIYQQTKDWTSIRSRRTNVVVAACLTYACRMEPSNIRTFQEIAKAANELGFGLEVKHIASTFKKIREQNLKLQEEKGVPMEMAVVNPADYVRRFCSHLHMEYTDDHQLHKLVDAVTATITNCEGMVQRKPTSVAAAAIFKHVKHKTTLKAVSEATGVAEKTIYLTYRDLTSEEHAGAPRNIPQQFRGTNDLH